MGQAHGRHDCLGPLEGHGMLVSGCGELVDCVPHLVRICGAKSS